MNQLVKILKDQKDKRLEKEALLDPYFSKYSKIIETILGNAVLEGAEKIKIETNRIKQLIEEELQKNKINQEESLLLQEKLTNILIDKIKEININNKEVLNNINKIEEVKVLNPVEKVKILNPVEEVSVKNLNGLDKGIQSILLWLKKPVSTEALLEKIHTQLISIPDNLKKLFKFSGKKTEDALRVILTKPEGQEYELSDVLTKVLEELKKTINKTGQKQERFFRAGIDPVGLKNIALAKINPATEDTLALIKTAVEIMDDWDNAASDGESVSGDVAHDGVDAGEPVKIGGKALDLGANPTAVAANDRTNAVFLRNGIQLILGGHPNILSQNLTITDADGAQTDTAIITVSAGTAIVVTCIEVTADNANTGDCGCRIGFGTANTPAQDAAGVILNHTGIAPGSGVVKGDGAGIIGIGASDQDLRVTCEDPAGGNLSITVTYFTISIG